MLKPTTTTEKLMLNLLSSHNMDIYHKSQSAIETLKRFEPLEGYFLAFSGGKDSIVCKHLLTLSGCKFESHYSVTSVDIPSVKPFIRTNFPDVIFDYPSLSMFQLIIKYGILPTRLVRYCCKFLKEYSGFGRVVVTGVRNSESTARRKRRLLEIDSRAHHTKLKSYVNPIISWTSDDVFRFVHIHKLFIPDYYADCLTARGGCVGCPMGGSKKQIHEFKLFPKYKAAYIKAINKAIINGKFSHFNNADEVMEYWLSGLSFKNFKQSQKQTSLHFP